jgi:hypothetical protein
MGRVACLLAVVLVLAGCGTDRKETPAPSVPVTATPSVETPPSDAPVTDPPDSGAPESAPGDLSDQAQAYLDEAIGTELGALEAAPPATVGDRRKTLDNLPEKPDQVVAALKDYQWLSPEAAALYRKATS